MGDDLNILIIGPSQSGKSTLINKIAELCEREPGYEPALEGDGSKSCTKTCKEHNLLFRRTRYKLMERVTTWDPIGRERTGLQQVDVSEDNENHLFRKIWKKKTADDCEIVPLEENPRMVNLRLIDTPGLDDSFGSDDRNIAEVMMHLKTLSQAGEGCNHLTAIVFVLSSTEAFGAKLQAIYRYYQSCMPNLFGGLAVINTRFSIEEWQQKWVQVQNRPARSVIKKFSKSARPDSARVVTMRERREEFHNKFGQDARQFYIDSAPDPYLLVEELITRNQIYDMVNYFMSQNPMPIQNIRLVKSGTMIQVDETLSRWLKDAKLRLSQRERELFILADSGGQLQASTIKRTLTLESEIEQMKKELALFDNNSKFTIRTYSTAPHHELSAPQSIWNKMVRTSIKDTLIIKEPDYPGFSVEADSNLPYSQWTHKEWNGDRTVWLGQYRASPGHIPSLEAIVSIENRKHYRVLIEGLNRRILEAKLAIEEAKKLQDYFDSQNDIKPMDPELKEISELIPHCDTLINQLCLDWNSITMGFDQVDRERYKKARSSGIDSVSVEDLFEFVQSQGYHSLEIKLRTMDKLGR
ncbi:hypothetical protein TWF730_008706 [Orbilia blumenaviensis]|uniref:G domain-containing protein n=1 Tax=Orbilia blumenaviensis TaxID=1796055 RepID=A0AAV9V5H3_9PEZI